MASPPVKVAIADFNQDGKPDIAYLLSPAPSVSILLGQGNGTFFGPLATTFGQAAYTMAVGDVNNDGFPDVITFDQTTSTIYILIGNGDGTFRTARTIFGQAFGIAIGDFNGDGKADFAATSLSSVTIYLGNGDGTFNAGVPISVGGNGANALVAGDFNHDGKLDLAITSRTSSNMSVLLGHGDVPGRRSVKSPAGKLCHSLLPFRSLLIDCTHHGFEPPLSAYQSRQLPGVHPRRR